MLSLIPKFTLSLQKINVLSKASLNFVKLLCLTQHQAKHWQGNSKLVSAGNVKVPLLNGQFIKGILKKYHNTNCFFYVVMLQSHQCLVSSPLCGDLKFSLQSSKLFLSKMQELTTLPSVYSQQVKRYSKELVYW